MSKVRIEVENLSKQYRLGQVGTGTLSHDLNRFWHKIRGKEDPYSKIGAVNDRATKTEDKYVWALRDINFKVNEGDVLGIIGRNGAGKSTLLKILSRVTGPTEGSIKINGRIGALLEVGTGMHPELTGRENIFLNGAILGMTKPEIKSKFDEIVDFSGIEKYIDTPLKRYSSGMRVRLGFAVAAFLEPEILIVDEVLAVGDAEFQKRAIGKMQEVSQGHGRTVLFVSHNMSSVQSLCNRVVVLENGQVKYDGITDEGIDYYIKSSLDYSSKLLINRNEDKNKNSFLITSFNIIDSFGDKVDDILSGKSYQFCINIHNPGIVDNAYVRIAFKDSKENIRFICNSRFSKPDFSLEGKSALVCCKINNFPLPKGIYFIDVSIRFGEVTFDNVENIYSFNVIGGDFFGHGKDQISSDGVYVEHSFHLNK